MKILFLGKYNPAEILSGPEKVAKRLFTGIGKDDEAVFAEYFFDGREFGLFKKLFGKELISSSGRNKVLRLGLFTLMIYLFRYKPDIVHLVTYERFYFVTFFCKLFIKAKFIYNVHGIIIHENKHYRETGRFYAWKDKVCEKVYLKYSDALIFLSEESVNIASKYFKLNSKKISVLPNGIDEVFHLTGMKKQYEEIKTLKIVFTGNINRKEKGFDFLKSVLYKSDIPFEIYLTSNTDPAEDNRFIPVPIVDTDSFAAYLKDKDVFISASEYEPFSISAAEAMAAGVVPIVTRQTGMSKYIDDGVNGYIFEYGNEDELRKILLQVNLNINLLKETSLCSVKIYDQISWEKVCEMYQKIYIKTLSSQ